MNNCADLRRGGHDPRKVYAAYKAAMEHKGRPPSSWRKRSKAMASVKAGKAKTSRISRRN